MDSDGCPEQYPVPEKAAAKDTEGRNEPDILPAEDVDEGHESSQLKKKKTELVRSIKTPSSATLLALPPLPGQEEEQYEELDEAEVYISAESLQQPYCKKPARFWCLLTVGLATIIAIVLVAVLTGNYSYNTKSVCFISRPSLVVPSVSIDVIILNYCFKIAPMLWPYYFL